MPKRLDAFPYATFLAQLIRHLMAHRRLYLLAGGLCALIVLAHLAGVGKYVTRDYLHALILAHHVLGWLAFIAVFCAGNLLHLSGILFLSAAVWVLGPVEGGVLTYVAANVSCLVSFVSLRWLGGDALRAIQSPLLQKLLSRLDAQPLASVVLLRTCFQTLPSLNAALALSGLRLKPYVLGGLIGLPLPIAAYCAVLHFFIHSVA